MIDNPKTVINSLNEYFKSQINKLNEFQTNKFLWNINYYIQNIHLEQNKKEANDLAYFLTLFKFWNKIKMEKEKHFGKKE